MKTHTQRLKRFFAILLFFTLVFVFPNSSAADSFDDGVQAYEAGDFRKALEIFKSLAEKGIPFAQFNLGIMYDKGRGVSQDYAEAVKWYRRAAEQGYAMAKYNLGSMHQNGQGVRQDYAEAVKWYRRAAEQGIIVAQFNLAIMYINGRGVRQDYIEAHKWLDLVAFRLPPSDKKKFAQENRDLLEKKMTRDQIAEARKLAREWKPKPNKSP